MHPRENENSLGLVSVTQGEPAPLPEFDIP
jgi:hypothetical protein